MIVVDKMDIFNERVSHQLQYVIADYGACALGEMYHGMGHYLVLVEHLNINNERRYDIIVTGGSNAYNSFSNHQDLVHRLQHPTDLYTMSEVNTVAPILRDVSPYCTRNEFLSVARSQ